MKDLILQSTSPVIASQLQRWNEMAANAFSPNTARSYRTACADFTRWCERMGVSALPASPETVAAHLRALAEAGKAVATVKHRTAAIRKLHEAAGLPNPIDSQAVRLMLRADARTRGTQQKQALPLTQRHADRIMGRMEGQKLTPKAARDLAVMLVGRDLLARASELATLTVEDFTWKEDGNALVTMRRYKTDTKARTYLIGQDSTAALRRWLQLADITIGPIFVAIQSNGFPRRNTAGLARPITTQVVGMILKELMGNDSYSAHSLRVGMAHDLVAEGLEVGTIMQAGAWKSAAMVARYTTDLKAERGAIAQYHARRQR